MPLMAYTGPRYPGVREHTNRNKISYVVACKQRIYICTNPQPTNVTIVQNDHAPTNNYTTTCPEINRELRSRHQFQHSNYRLQRELLPKMPQAIMHCRLRKRSSPPRASKLPDGSAIITLAHAEKNVGRAYTDAYTVPIAAHCPVPVARFIHVPLRESRMQFCHHPKQSVTLACVYVRACTCDCRVGNSSHNSKRQNLACTLRHTPVYV
jgi:hypothetical protein